MVNKHEMNKTFTKRFIFKICLNLGGFVLGVFVLGGFVLGGFVWGVLSWGVLSWGVLSGTPGKWTCGIYVIILRACELVLMGGKPT